jgi:hypothetical protein
MSPKRRIESAATFGINGEYAFEGFVKTVVWEETTVAETVAFLWT